MRKSKRIDELFGVWAMEPSRATRLVDFVRSIDLQLHIAAHQDTGGFEPQTTDVEPQGAIAVIPLSGVMTKSGAGDSMTQTVSTAMVRRAVQKVDADPKFSAMLLLIDSPGGSAHGTADLAQTVASAKKPVLAYIEDCGCSAAYWVASQADKVLANQSAWVGSIGTYMVIDDLSKMYETKGIKTHVIRAGAFKGAGTEGTEITSEQIKEFQSEVNAVNDLFLQGVERGRKNLSRERVAQLADGRAHIASEAVRLGLIDGTSTFDAAVETLRQMAASGGNGVSTMQNEDKKAVLAADGEEKKAADEKPTDDEDDDKKKPDDPSYSAAKGDIAASYKQLKAALPGASAEFLTKAMDADMSVAQATAAYSLEMAKNMDSLEKRVVALETGGKAVAFSPGRGARATEPVAGNDRKADWEKNKSAYEAEGYKDFEHWNRVQDQVDATFASPARN